MCDCVYIVCLLSMHAVVCTLQATNAVIGIPPVGRIGGDTASGV